MRNKCAVCQKQGGRWDMYPLTINVTSGTGEPVKREVHVCETCYAVIHAIAEKILKTVVGGSNA